MYSLHENKKKIFFTGVEIIGHSRLGGIKGWVPHSEFNSFGVKSVLHILNPILSSVYLGLSPFWCWVYSMLSPNLSLVHLWISPFQCWVYSMLSLNVSSVHSQFNQFSVHSIQGWVPSGLSTLGVESFQGWVHSGLSPIWGWVHSNKSSVLGSVVLGSVSESAEQHAPH